MAPTSAANAVTESDHGSTRTSSETAGSPDSERAWKELVETTEWSNYGHKSGNPKCANCMVHCGFEATAVNDHFARPGASLVNALSG